MEKPNIWAGMPLIRNIFLAAVSKGADLSELCRAIGVTPETLDRPDAFVDLDQSIEAWKAAIRTTGDSFLGLHMGEVTSPGLAGILGFLMETSPDLLNAFTHATQFNGYISNMTVFTLEVRGDEFFYFAEPLEVWNNASPETARQVVDHSAAAFVHLTKLLSGKTKYPLRVSMRYPRPQDTREYLRVLKTEPLFNQTCNCLVYRLRDMHLPVIGHNPQLNQMFRELLEKEIAKTKQRATFTNEVRRVILQNFSSTMPQLNDVVEYLHVTPRTLQRKLQEEGTSFQHIAESVKSELAIGLLKNRSLTVNEVAYRLGYTEPSVFRRAFKKWTGVSPKSYPK
ncbi:MAG: AraC family transcriptional regulator [Haliscomenobacteraceae bacterium CHB4]|nr:putative HTH-type transcriptional regulator [Saprospiraceae bacterium]MCE7923321.1 AraC family transcriptional regulator [Haliscomenobacteraceae bacterium CHB4]